MATQIPALINPHKITSEGNNETTRVFVQLALQPDNKNWSVVSGEEKINGDGIYEIDDNFKVLVEAVHGDLKIPENNLQVFSYDSENKTLKPMNASELEKIASI